ncbi:MAG: hypothetical protein ACK47U_11200 [Verrucomicrobiota bacterium]|jgi:hypothetical protein
MSLRKLLTGLLLAALPLGTVAAETEPKNPGGSSGDAKKTAGKTGGDARSRSQAERTCALTVTWWEMPLLPEGETMELGVQGDREVTPIHPSAMTPSGTILYEGPANVAIVRKAMLPDPSGKPGAKPVETWVPFAGFNLAENDREALVIMFASEGAQKVMVRKFNINVEALPFGGFDVLNFSKNRLLCSMGGKVFYAEPSGRSRSPLVMTKREVVNFFMGVTDADGRQKLIYRAPLILHEKNRRICFVLENPAAESENRFVCYTIIQHVSGHRTIESLRGLRANPPSAEPTPEASPAPATETEAPKNGSAKPKAA